MERVMQYWIYENWTHERARLHIGSCSHCNEGKGSQASSSVRNGQWHGPFDNLSEADRTMAALRRSDSSYCSHCNAGPTLT
jgi:hypothetical protein